MSCKHVAAAGATDISDNGDFHSVCRYCSNKITGFWKDGVFSGWITDLGVASSS
jgi:hypothetical protein